jgi:hypothetical protein
MKIKNSKAGQIFVYHLFFGVTVYLSILGAVVLSVPQVQDYFAGQIKQIERGISCTLTI